MKASVIIDVLLGINEEGDKEVQWIIDEYDGDEEFMEDEDIEIIKSIKEECGDFAIVDREGGGEGEGEHVSRVIHFKDHDVFIRYDGYYESNNGIEWDGDFAEVRPRRTLKIVYETPDERENKTDEV